MSPTGDELIYLDPHTTQPAVEPSDSGFIADDSFHCQHPPCRMHVSEIDPSIAVVSEIVGNCKCKNIAVTYSNQFTL